MDAYLDASVLVPLLTKDALTELAAKFLSEKMPKLFVSDFACTEFVSVIARRVRTHDITPSEAREIFEKFDTWRLQETQPVTLQPGDVANAEIFLRRLDLTLRAPDALHIAMAKRTGAALATFDTKMAASAQNLGLDVAAA